MIALIGTGLVAVVLGGTLAVVSFGIAFALGVRRAVLAVLLVRSSSDPIFGMGKSAIGGEMGPGAAMTALVISLALLFFLQSPVLIGSALLPWAAFLMTTAASAFLSPEPMQALKTFLWLISYAAAFALPFGIIRSPEWALRSLIVVMCSSIIPVGYAVVELASGSSATAEGIRLESTFAHPNIFGFYLVSVLALTLFLLRTSLISMPPRVRLLLVLFLPVIIILLILTGARTQWSAAAIILIVYASIIDKRYLLCLVLVPLLSYIPGVEERLSDLQSGNDDYGYAPLNSYAWRKILWQRALDWLMANPSTSLVLGYGLGSFEHYMPEFFAGRGIFGAHSVFLQIFFEMGILGLLAFLGLFVSLYTKLRKGFSFDWAGSIMMMTFALSFLVGCYSDNLLDYLAAEWYFWFILGVVCAWYRLCATSQPVQDYTLAVQGPTLARSAGPHTA